MKARYSNILALRLTNEPLALTGPRGPRIGTDPRVRESGRQNPMVKDVSPKEAYEILQKDPSAVILDVRSRVEYDYVGHPLGAVHVAWQEFPDWQADPDFAHQARLRLADARGTTTPENDLTVLVICRSGGRSRAAAQALEDAGFRRVINISEGFEGDRDAERHRGTLGGWRFHGLPWEQT